ncbi:MAG: 30S ribosomal protein S6 [Phycisphaerae bacterium]|nr:MAG: 30S ribosomal protein S6 [Planctomycetes bacterium GWC2_45_44]HBG78227.1 30S ribosomal protein S6 [Phycisphaerales bacterium]HBR18780.1 30S ribosomal protein S6 [Phycisphaerales bacterium]
METVTKRLYEALILVDSAEAIADWQGINDHIKKILDRSEVEIVSMRKWDERPLAYEIEGKKRGTYILVYFNCATEKLTVIERDFQLSERVVRALILRGDHITKEDMEKDTPFQMFEKGVVPPPSPAAVVAEAAKKPVSDVVIPPEVAEELEK